MGQTELEAFDLTRPAPNGLRRGRTTGSCATAAVKAALYCLLRDEQRAQVQISLPDGVHYLAVPIEVSRWLDAQTVRVDVRKDGGDDPDNTHDAIIFVELRRNDSGQIRFRAAAGVGTATKPGLRVAPGEPAINPVPRQMMRQAIAEVLAEVMPLHRNVGFDVAIGCEDGEAIARKTFNPRLGILGGISILGTSGIVEPLSLASWIASVEVYVRVALGDGATHVAYLPGKIGRQYAREVLHLPEQGMVQIANFLGDALDFMQVALLEQARQLEVLWLLGHPGKLAKVLDGVWDTHSSKSAMAMGSVARVAAELGFSERVVHALQNANTVEAALELLKAEPGAQAFWMEVERRIAALVQMRVPAVQRVEVRLFDLHGNLLGTP